MIAAFCWMAAVIILAIIEVITLGLTCIWFAGGALIAAIVAAFGGPIWLQILVFAVVSVVLLVFTRPIAKKYFDKSLKKTNAEEMIGKKVVVTEAVDNLLGKGTAVSSGLEWTARAKNENEKFAENEAAIVAEIQGVKLLLVKDEDDKAIHEEPIA